MRVFGIDPGCSGAVVLLDSGQPVEWLMMPTIKIGKASRVNAAALAAWLQQHQQFAHTWATDAGLLPRGTAPAR